VTADDKEEKGGERIQEEKTLHHRSVK